MGDDKLKSDKALNNAANFAASAFASNPTGVYATVFKRAFDIVLAIAILPVLIPVIAVLWVIATRDGGSGFFGHLRVGKDGVPFRCWKVRTMVMGAQARLEQHLKDDPEAAQEWAEDHKLTNDPRITTHGNFLRRTSLDELPQIINVLKGEMSFVGPRPIVEDELVRYGPYKAMYLSLRPGITGLWQVSGRNDISYDERVNLDLDYSRKIGFFLDCRLILATAGTVLKRSGK